MEKRFSYLAIIGREIWEERNRGTTFPGSVVGSEMKSLLIQLNQQVLFGAMERSRNHRAGPDISFLIPNLREHLPFAKNRIVIAELRELANELHPRVNRTR